jgi:hypothetical protein
MPEPPPNYQPQPARFGEKCENCKFGEQAGKARRWKKYEQTVRLNWCCDSWERDGVFRVF